MDDSAALAREEIGTAMDRIRCVYADWARNCGISCQELRILYILRRRGACTQRDICRGGYIPKQTVNNVITALERAGYVTLLRDGEDRREKKISLTKNGLEYADRFAAPLLAAEKAAFKKMGNERVLLLSELLLTFGDLLDEAVDRGAIGD